MSHLAGDALAKLMNSPIVSNIDEKVNDCVGLMRRLSISRVISTNNGCGKLTMGPLDNYEYSLHNQGIIDKETQVRVNAWSSVIKS